MAVKFLKDENGKLYKDTATGKLLTVDTALPELANPATAEDITSGKEAYGADGEVITGTAEKVENKLPLVVGAQSADNLYDISASDLDGMTTIGNYAFYQKRGLRSITLPTTCTSISVYAFQSCTSLITVNMPSVTSIGNYAFFYCSGLTSVNMPNATSIGNGVFNACSALTSISIPNATSIGSEFVYNCTSLTSLTIPSTCPSIGSSALRCGTSSNKCTFTFEGTTPPTIYTDTFRASCINKIIVPVGCGETYKTATNWTTFADYIEEATE